MEDGAQPRKEAGPGGAFGRALTGASMILGSAALLGAMAVDFTSVVGRHVGFRVIGAIEIVQVCIVVAIAAALVAATLKGSHAAVHIITTRLKPPSKRFMARISDLLTAAVFTAFLMGDIWLAADVWSENERSDLLHLPMVPARLIWCAGLLLTVLISLYAAFNAPEEDQPSEL